mgnify:CR=1 FL=1
MTIEYNHSLLLEEETMVEVVVGIIILAFAIPVFWLLIRALRRLERAQQDEHDVNERKIQ